MSILKDYFPYLHKYTVLAIVFREKTREWFDDKTSTKKIPATPDSAKLLERIKIHEKWIPLFTRLEAEKFSPNEISALERIFMDKNTPEKISHRLIEWAKELK